jgi:hypothetical protein
MDKKGAIEFSMTTIMVVIIGVAVLALGLTWIRGTFSQVGGITDEAFESAKAELGQDLTRDDPLGVSPSTISLRPGDSTTVAVSFLNGISPPTDITDAKIVVDQTLLGNTLDAVIDATAKPITSGNIFDWRVVIKAKDSAVVGSNIVANVKVTSTAITREKPLVINIV